MDMKATASTMVEFVMALAIIGTCFSIASIIFSRTNRSTIQFQEVMDQSEVQSLLFEQYILDTFIEQPDWRNTETTLQVISTDTSKNYEFHSYLLQSSQKKIWEQYFYLPRNK